MKRIFQPNDQVLLLVGQSDRQSRNPLAIVCSCGEAFPQIPLRPENKRTIKIDDAGVMNLNKLAKRMFLNRPPF